MKRILFVVVPLDYVNQEDLKKFKRVNNTASEMPLGVLNIASYIQARIPELKIQILDLNIVGMTFDHMRELISEQVRAYQPDIVAFSAMFNFACHHIKTFSQAVKEVDQTILTLAGGIAVSQLYKEILTDFAAVDAVCFNEGEIPFYDLLSADDIQFVLEQHPSWCTKKSCCEGKIPTATVLDNLDEIPPLNYDLIDINAYQPVLRMDVDTIENKHTFSIQTSRGCPFNCVFCTTATVNGKKMRYFSAKRVIEDIERIVKEYGVRSVYIVEDQFLLNKKRAIEILYGIAPLKLTVFAGNGVNCDFIDEDIAKALAAAGVKNIFLAVESGSKRMLQYFIDKKVDLDRLEERIQCLKEHNISVEGLFVLGIPGETNLDRDETERLVKHTSFDWHAFNVATPWRGTRLYDICVENHYIDAQDPFDTGAHGRGIIRTPDIEPDVITRYAYHLNLQYNFIENSNIVAGNYSKALKYFSRVAKNYPFHAFAHYCAWFCLEKLDRHDDAQAAYNKFLETIQVQEWYDYAKEFQLI